MEDTATQEILNGIAGTLHAIETILVKKDLEESRKSRYLYCLDADAAAAIVIFNNLNIDYVQGRAPLNSPATIHEFTLNCTPDQYNVLKAKIQAEAPELYATEERPLITVSAT